MSKQPKEGAREGKETGYTVGKRRREAEGARAVQWEAGGRARRRAAATQAEPLANSRAQTLAREEAAQLSPRRSRAWVARGPAWEARVCAQEADRGRSRPRSWALPRAALSLPASASGRG